MREFRDPARIGLAAIVALCAYMALKALVAIMLVAARPDDISLGLLALGYLAALFASYVLVGFWIYRTNANAHAFSSALTISPGWSVGWFFVPFANLVMPYRGVKEVWQESHECAGRREEVDSPLPGWWWGLWIATNISSNIASFVGAWQADAAQGALYLNLIAAALGVAASLVLIELIRRLDRAQLAASRGSVFA
jgi:hypothetical protein